MSEKSKTNAEEVQFPLNLRLLEDSAKIKEERKIIRERLNKIEASRDKVTESVYNKVKSDYTNQLNNNTNLLLEKKQDIDRELSTLYEAKKKVEENVYSHKDKLEEMNFRHSLGEFKNGEFHKLSDEENQKLGKFEKILAAIESNINQYESLFEDEDDIEMGPKEVRSTPAPPSPRERMSQKTASTEEEYHVGSGDDYFGASTDEVQIKPDNIGETTSKDITAPTFEDERAAAKITIIKGYGEGDVFNLTESEMTIGRASSNYIALKEAKVSRQHAMIKKQGTEYLLEDLHSSNGVFVNDEKIKEHVLTDGDIIQIGDFILKFTS